MRSIGTGRRQACAGDDSRLPIISEEPFFADTVRAKTLSYRTLTYDGASLVLGAAGYLSFPGGIAMAAGLGWPVPHDVTICELSATKGLAAGALTIEVRVAGVAVTSIVIPDTFLGASDTTINVNVAAGSMIEFYATAAVAVGCSIRAVCRRRI